MNNANQVRGEWVEQRLPCTKCTSSDAVSVLLKQGKYTAWCFSCGAKVDDPPGYGDSQKDPTDKLSTTQVLQGSAMQHPPRQSFPPKTPQYFPSDQEILEEFRTYPFRALKDRGIRQETCEKYGVRVSLSPQDGETIITHMYPYYKKGNLSGYKERLVDNKQFFTKGDVTKTGLFGSHCHKNNQKTLYITEGEIDCLTLYQVLKDLSDLPNWEPAVVSLSHGSASAASDISSDIEYVSSFDKVILIFDQDEAGQRAVEDSCKILAGKVYYATLSEKDPNQMLLAGKAEELKWDVLKHARQYMPDNIVNYAECWDRYKHSKNQDCFYFPDTWTSLNQKTYGFRLGELVTVTSGSGMGKTQFLREVKHHLHETTDFSFADIALEEDVGDSMAGLMSLYLNKRITLPDVEVTDEEEKEAFDYYFGSGRWTGYDYFGGLDDDNLFSKIRFFAATGHKVIFLDHLSIVVSEFAASGGERERIDTIMTKLAKLVKELNITIFLVVHLKKTSGTTSFEEGATPSLDDLRGSGSLKQLSWTVIALSRNQQHEDPSCANTSKISVLKCRFTGRTGTADYLQFNDRTGRMIAVSKPPGYEPDKRNRGFSHVAEF